MHIIKTNLKFGSLSKRQTTTLIVLHHASAKNCAVEQVHQWHLNNGWSGIGYHFFVNKKGEIYEGRPINTIGSHTAGYNGCSIGICAEGNFEVESMTDCQKLAIAKLLKYVTNLYPYAVITGHKELKATACPGKNYPLKDLKNYKTYLGVVAEMEQLKKEIQTMKNEIEILKNQNKVYKYIYDMPDYIKPTVQKLYNKGVLKGTGNGEFNLSGESLRLLVILDRQKLFD